MKKESLYKLIAETKPHLRTASPEQKLRLMRLIREGLKQYKKNVVKESVTNKDYLEEK